MHEIKETFIHERAVLDNGLFWWGGAAGVFDLRHDLRVESGPGQGPQIEI